MRFGNLINAVNGDDTIINVINENMQPSLSEAKKPTRFAKILTRLSHYGMSYNDKVYKNMMAIPADKNLQPKDDALLQQTLYGGGLNNWKVKPEEEKTETKPEIKDEVTDNKTEVKDETPNTGRQEVNVQAIVAVVMLGVVGAVVVSKKRA